MSMNCHSCGAVIRVKGNYCQACGVVLASTSEPTQAKAESNEAKPEQSQKTTPNKLSSALQSACPKGETEREKGEFILSKAVETSDPESSIKDKRSIKPERFQHITLAEYQQIKYESESSASNKVPAQSRIVEVDSVEEQIIEEEEEEEDDDDDYKHGESEEQSFTPSSRDTIVIKVQRKPLIIAIVLSAICGVAYFGFAGKLIRPIQESPEKQAVNSPLKFRGELSRNYAEKSKESLEEERGKLLAPLDSKVLSDNSSQTYKPGNEPEPEPISKKPPVSTKHLPDPHKPTHDLSTPLVISGEWQIKYQSDNVVDRVTIKQWGDTFEGHGFAHYKNGDIHAFEITDGTIDLNKIQFTKRFYSKQKDGKVHPHPVSFRGTVDRSEDQLLASGIFDTKFNVGHFNNKREAARSGPWNAVLIEPHAAESNLQPIHVNMPPFQYNLLLGMGFLVICSVIAFISFKLFSSSGLISRLQGEEKIPAEYRKRRREIMKEMGQNLTAGSLPLGKRSAWSQWFPVGPKMLTLPAEARQSAPNVLLLGNSGSGKTKLMASMIIEDIKSDDRAVVIIDPDDSLSDLVIEHIAGNTEMEEHASRFLILDPTIASDELYYFNPLEISQGEDLFTVCNLIVDTFKSLDGDINPWSEQTENIFKNTILLLALNDKTLCDIPQLLQNLDFRDELIAKLEGRKIDDDRYKAILEHWYQYKELAKENRWQSLIEPVLNRLEPILDDPRIRRVFEKPKSTLDLKEVISGAYVLILKLPEAELHENANMLGSLLIARLKQTSITLHKQNRKEYNALAVYLKHLDRFFSRETFEGLIANSKRYQIGCIASLETLANVSEELKEMILVMIDTFLVFRTSVEDSETISVSMLNHRNIYSCILGNDNFDELKNDTSSWSISEECKMYSSLLSDQQDGSFYCLRNGSPGAIFALESETFQYGNSELINQELIEEMWCLKNLNDDNFSQVGKE